MDFKKAFLATPPPEAATLLDPSNGLGAAPREERHSTRDEAPRVRILQPYQGRAQPKALELGHRNSAADGLGTAALENQLHRLLRAPVDPSPPPPSSV